MFLIIKVCRRTSEDLSVFVVFLIKVCRRTSEDLSVFVVFLLIIFIILSYFSLQQIFSNDFFLISQPISIKFGMLIVLDETNRLNIFFKSIGPGVGTGRGPKVLLCFFNRKNSIYCA